MEIGQHKHERMHQGKPAEHSDATACINYWFTKKTLLYLTFIYPD